MAGPLRTPAVVLSGTRYGEADRILHVFTPEHGRRSVIARGARKPRSKLGGRLEAPAYVELDLHEGRGDIATVTGVTTIAALPRLREHLDAIEAAMHACDDVGRLFGDGEAHPPIFHLLANYLVALDTDSSTATAGRQLAFRLKLLYGAGVAPELSRCARCGAAGPLVAFSGADGGLLCSGCATSGFSLEPEVIAALGGALAAPLAQAPEPRGRAARQVDRAITDLAQHHLGVNLRGLRLPD